MLFGPLMASAASLALQAAAAPAKTSGTGNADLPLLLLLLVVVVVQEPWDCGVSVVEGQTVTAVHHVQVRTPVV